MNSHMSVKNTNHFPKSFTCCFVQLLSNIIHKTYFQQPPYVTTALYRIARSLYSLFISKKIYCYERETPDREFQSGSRDLNR